MKIEYQVVRSRLKTEFVTNHRAIRDNRQLIVTLTKNGAQGIGTGLLSYDDQVLQFQISKFISHIENYSRILAGAPTSLDGISELIRILKLVAPNATLEHEALDLALYDLFGKLQRKPVFEIFGYTGKQLLPSGFSISAPKDVYSFAEELEKIDKTLPILKLKMKSNSDLGMVELLRSQYDGRIWIDGNCAWDSGDLETNLRYFDKFDVEIVEQPLREGHYEALLRFKDRTGCVLIADEDCVDTHSLEKIRSYYNGVSIKLHKCGGLLEANNMMKTSKNFGLKIMLGCRTENLIGITAISNLGEGADYLDLDGAVDILDDEFDGLEFEKGKLRRATSYGLGVKRRDDMS